MKQNEVVDYRAIHLDLKGVPPEYDRLVKLLDVFKAGGFNALLIEWEDMFPWTVDERFRCETAYTKEQVLEFHKIAKEKGFEIIPLVQCLGHLETVLRIDDYAHLREVQHKCDCLNPLADGASELISKLIDDVLELSGDIKYFHLGGDEAYEFGSHPDTKAYIEKNGKAALYMKHIQPLLDKLDSKGIRAILWHDMMIKWDDDALKKLAEKADLCVWGYGETPHETSMHYNIKYVEKFEKVGVPMWGGAAYKGADGPSRDVPDPHTRRRNTLAWVKAAKDHNFKGLFATAWSRYSTTRVQCEPIDACLDAMLYIGWILAYDYTPADYQEQAYKKLKELGEFELFEKCFNVCSRLDFFRSLFWDRVQEFFEQSALDKLQPQRRAYEIHMNTADVLNEHFTNAKKWAVEFHKVFKGLIPEVWIDEYLRTRLDAMESFMPEMKQKMEDALAGVDTK